jgi:hypothetical protein
MSSGKMQWFAIMRHFIQSWVQCDNSEFIQNALCNGSNKKLTPLKAAIFVQPIYSWVSHPCM